MRVAVISAAVGISIHAPRVGRDDTRVGHKTNGNNFNPRAPCGARRYTPYCCFTQNKFQSTRPVWGATVLTLGRTDDFVISIHAPRVGRDVLHRPELAGPSDFNPRAPCGARQEKTYTFNQKKVFQSTRPVWGATGSITELNGVMVDFNPRAPCGARRDCVRSTLDRTRISIHAPRVGRDAAPCGGATLMSVISIHAPRVGRDVCQPSTCGPGWYFNPRAPCGARRYRHTGCAD